MCTQQEAALISAVLISAAVGSLTDPLWSNTATTAADRQLSRYTLGVFLLEILQMYGPYIQEGQLFSFKKQKWRMGSIISSSNAKHDYYFHVCVGHISVNPIQASVLILNTLTLSPATPLCPTWPSSPCGYGCVSQECRENDWISGHGSFMVTDVLLTLGPSSPGEPGGPVGPCSPWKKRRKGNDHIFYFLWWILK